MVVVDCNATHCRWRPDVTFLHLDPEQVIFPRHDADAWAKGDKRTASEGLHIGMVNINLEGNFFTSAFFKEHAAHFVGDLRLFWQMETASKRRLVIGRKKTFL